jgi:predicted ATPase
MSVPDTRRTRCAAKTDATIGAMPRTILERGRELAVLGVAAREAQAGQGSIVLIEGEAGIGKSSLVESVRSVLPAEGRLLKGWCDDLATPRVLGPLRDMREHVGTPLRTALDAGDRGRVAEALLAELDWAGHASVLVVEDVHWADEATLDVLRFLVSRIAGLPAVLVLTTGTRSRRTTRSVTCWGSCPARHVSSGCTCRTCRWRRCAP